MYASVSLNKEDQLITCMLLLLLWHFHK